MNWIHLSQDKDHQRIILTMVIRQWLYRRWETSCKSERPLNAEVSDLFILLVYFFILFAEGKNFFLHSIL